MEGQEKQIDYTQMRDAEAYVNSYIKFIGGNPPVDYPEEEKDIPKGWPESVKKAWLIVDKFYKQNEGYLF